MKHVLSAYQTLWFASLKETDSGILQTKTTYEIVMHEIML